MARPHAAASKDKPSNPNKRKLLDDSDSESDDGAAIGSSSFKVNEEYARRFEHNKKREETQRCMFQFHFPIQYQCVLPLTSTSGREDQEGGGE